MAVVDASVLVEYLAGGERQADARRVLVAGEDVLWAPHLVDAEVGHALRRAVRLGEIRPSVAAFALQELARLPLQRAAHVALLDRAWELRDTVSFYDALYVALAERLALRLVTFDARLAGASGVRAAVDVLGSRP